MPPRPDDSAVRADQQEWGAAGQKPVPPGHGAGGFGYPGALSGGSGRAVSTPHEDPVWFNYISRVFV